MPYHIHVGFADFVVFVLYLLVAGALIRMFEVLNHNNRIGQALNFIY